MPIAIHPISRSQLCAPSPNIIEKHTIIPKIGTKGTHGVRNGRGISGLDFLIINIPAQTNTNANKVPILVISPTISPGTTAATIPIKTKKIRLDL